VRVEATDLLAEFQQLIDNFPAEAGAGSTELLLQGLEPAETELLRRCAIPHQFSLPMLALLSPLLSEQELRQHFETFTRLPIITPTSETLMMHDQSRKYLFAQWLEPKRQTELAEISGRLADFFQKGIDGAEGSTRESYQRRRMYHLIGFDQDKGLDDFERLCRERKRDFRLTEYESLLKLVHEYDPILTPRNRVRVAYHEGKLAADLRDWERAKALFESIDNTSAPSEYRFKALNRLGMLHVELRKLDVAIQYYDRARDFAAQQGDRHVYLTLLELGSAYRDREDFAKAEELLEEGIALAKKAHSFFSVAVGYNSLGMLHRRLNDIPRAILDYEESLKNLDRIKDRFRRGQVLSELGAAYTERRDWATAEKYFLDSLEIERTAGDKHNQAIVQNNLVRVYQSRGQQKEALEAARQAMLLFQETRDFYRAAMSTRNYAKLCRATKDRAGCEQAFKDAIEQFRRCNETKAAEETERELSALTRKVGLPWWAWVLLAGLSAFIVYLTLGVFGFI
jgi:tetratricopeptide (TPR) repeat protein